MLANGAILLLTVVFSLIPLLLTARLKRQLPRYAQGTGSGGATPKVAVVLPCKGLDPGFVLNIESVFAQSYPSLELHFVVATADDPAAGPLTAMIGAHPNVNAKLWVSRISSQRAQKVTSQLMAVRNVSAEVETLVFLDSDARPDPTFIRRLVAPLSDPKIGATTGYRWYHQSKPTLGSLLRSTWNAGAVPFLVDPKRIFAWGGAMAIHRSVFDRAGIAQSWDRAVSDDLTLTVAVRNAGLELRFVPACIAVSYEPSTVAEAIEFTNRQSVISRVYFSPLWWGAALGHSSANFLTAYGLFCLAMFARTGAAQWLVGAGCLVVLPAQLINAASLLGPVCSLLPEAVAREVRQQRWLYVFTAPLTSVMSLINTLHSSMTRRIVWRGVGYELRSTTETVVLPGPCALVAKAGHA